MLARVLREEPWRGDRSWTAGFEGGIAHRLDTATSGALVLADSPDELLWLRACFSEHRFEKRYRFVAARDADWAENTCDRAIAHSRTHKGKMIVQRGSATPHRGRWLPAETRFSRLGGRLFEATMSTGVMHQIRVHAAFLGIPLQGDRRYGGGPALGDGVDFRLHHVGLEGPDGFRSASVPLPAWAANAQGE